MPLTNTFRVTTNPSTEPVNFLNQLNLALAQLAILLKTNENTAHTEVTTLTRLLSDDLLVSDDQFLIFGDDSDLKLSSSTPGQLVFTPPADTDIEFVFSGSTGPDGATNTGRFKWMEDEDYFEFPDAIVSTSTITATGFTSTIAIGTAPYSCTSTTLNTNLNADLLDGQHGSYYASATGYVPYTGATEDVDLGVYGLKANGRDVIRYGWLNS